MNRYNSESFNTDQLSKGFGTRKSDSLCHGASPQRKKFLADVEYEPDIQDDAEEDCVIMVRQQAEEAEGGDMIEIEEDPVAESRSVKTQACATMSAVPVISESMISAKEIIDALEGSDEDADERINTICHRIFGFKASTEGICASI